MPQLLISVTSVEEAKLALPYADIIDLKDPSQGALGALPLKTIKEVVKFVGHQKLVSATIGDLPMDATQIFNAVQAMQATQVDFIKIGFFEAENIQACLDALAPLVKNNVKLIAVLFAEKKYSADLIKKICAAGFVGVMLDTAIKNGRTLFDYYSTQALAEFCRAVRTKHMKIGLAGSLNSTHLEAIKQLNPSYMGFRGGVCESQNRTFSLSEEKIKALCKLL
jgi:uncharacterized protein (UPF0264 family)